MQMAQLAVNSSKFQRLHGMGEELYAEIVGADKLNVPCRRLRTRRPPRRLAPLPGGALAGKRREHLVREPHRR